MRRNKYIIAGDYVNAISIWHALAELGVHKTDVVFMNLSGRNLSGILYPEIETLNEINTYNNLLNYLESLNKSVIKFLFLTSELFHVDLWKNKENLKQLNVVFYIGNSNPSRIIIKEDFLSEIDRNTNVPVPRVFTVDEINLKFNPVFVKFSSSFLNGKRAPKGKPFKNKNKLNLYIQKLLAEGYRKEDFVLQELLSTQTNENVSICGWYQKGFNRLYQTQKIIQHPPQNGNGDVVKLMRTDIELQKQAMAILEYFDYLGPFEIEFIKDRNTNSYKVIEMNPRFWMQHGLIEKISGNLLVAKYIGIGPTKEKLHYKYWIYTSIAIIQIAKFKFNYLKYLLKKNTYKPLSTKQAIIFLFKYLSIKSFKVNS